MEFLHTKNLTFAYPDSTENAVDSLSVEISEGEFVLLCGKTGCGKTTFLKLLKSELTPNGKMSGTITLFDDDITHAEPFSVGYVFQQPQLQIVCETVIDELAFGLENMGLCDDEISRRIAETAAFFGIEDMLYQNTNTLSGGSLQKLSLAAVIAMRPKLLLLDEPCAMLDKVSTDEFISLITRLNRETGITVIIAEHRTDLCFDIANKIMIMDKSRLICFDTPEKTAAFAAENEQILPIMPQSLKIFAKSTVKQNIYTIKSAHEYLKTYEKSALPIVSDMHDNEIALELKNIVFRYKKSGKNILDSLNLTIRKGEIFALLGSNAAGKSTLLKIISGITKQLSGSVKIYKKPISKYTEIELYSHIIGYLPQDVTILFTKDTVAEDYAEAIGDNTVGIFNIESYSERNPLDLSGGQRQIYALEKVMKKSPQILILDEPVKGIDANTKSEISSALKKIAQSGTTIIAVTHDTEFAAETADECAFMLGGKIVGKSDVHSFFSGNFCYTTTAARIAKDKFDGVITNDELIKILDEKAAKYEE